MSAWRRHLAELRLSLRMTVAGVAAFALGQLLGLPQAYWAVLTAVIVMQANVGASFEASPAIFSETRSGASSASLSRSSSWATISESSPIGCASWRSDLRHERRHGHDG